MIKNKLARHNLTGNFEEIRIKTPGEWKTQVKRAVEKRNKDRMKENCLTVAQGERKIKTKTKSIYETLREETYVRRPKEEILKCSKLETKALIIARHGMLECGSNFPGTLKRICDSCQQIDNEEHRLNHCKKMETNKFLQFTKQ